MLISIVMYPFPFQYTPKGFGDIEVRGIRREIEYVETSILPSFKTVLHLAALVDSGVSKTTTVSFMDTKREAFHKFDEPVGVYVILSGETIVNAIMVNHSEDVESTAFIYRHTEVLIFEFPRIRHISFCTYMAFITVIQINKSGFPLMFKLLQKFFLISILLRRGCPFGSFSYTSKSCAIKDKKFLKGPSLICFPVASSLHALALETLCRCFRIALSHRLLVLLGADNALAAIPRFYFSVPRFLRTGIF